MRIAKGGEYPYFHHLKNTIDKNTQKLFDKDVLNEQERSTAVDLYIEYNKNIADVNKFLLLEYSVLQNKVTKCARNRCYDDIFKDKQSIRFCVIECTQGIKDEREFQQMKIDFQECMEKTNRQSFNQTNNTNFCRILLLQINLNVENRHIPIINLFVLIISHQLSCSQQVHKLDLLSAYNIEQFLNRDITIESTNSCNNMFTKQIRIYFGL